MGKIAQGKVRVNQIVKTLNLKGETIERGRLTKLFIYQGINKLAVDMANAGDIICIAGLSKTSLQIQFVMIFQMFLCKQRL